MLLKNATVFLKDHFAQNTDVLVKNGVITQIGQHLQCEDDSVIDMSGDYLLPGFVDVHIHAFCGMDTMSGEEAVRHMSRELKKVGVAAFLPTTMSASPEATQAALKGIQAVMEHPEKDGAVVLGAHMEAPFLCEAKAGAQLKEYFAAPTVENWEMYTGEYSGIVRLITLAPELEGAYELIEYLSKKGITVSIGHTSADGDTVHKAAEHGASHVTHTFNAQSNLLHRAPGVPGAALVDDRLALEFISDGIHLHPDIVQLILRCKGNKLAVAITDAMEAAGMPDGKYQLGGQDVFVKNGAARLADGTLAGSTLTMINAFRNMIRFGISVADAAAATTCSPARSINETQYGVIEYGAKTPLIRLNHDFELIQVIA